MPIGVGSLWIDRTPEVNGRRKGGGRSCPDGVVRRPHVSNDAREMGVSIYERIRRLDDFVRHCFGRRRLIYMTCVVQLQLAVLCDVAHVGKNNKAGNFRSEPWPTAWRV